MTSTRCINRASSIVMLAVLLLLPNTSASAWCYIGNDWGAYTSVPVFHTPDLAPNMRHQDGSLWAEDELDWEISWALQTINSYSNANLPTLYNAGISPNWPCSGETCRRGGAITIIPQVQPTCDGGWDGDPVGGELINIERFAACGPSSVYEHQRSVANWNVQNTVLGFLVHELGGHAMGLGHSFGPCDGLVCDTWQCTVTSVPTSDETHTYYRDDVTGLRSIYGNGSFSNRVLRESWDGATWTNLPVDLPAGPMPSMSPLFSLSSSTGAKMFATYRDPGGVYTHASAWTWSPMTWADWGSAAERSPHFRAP